MKKDMKLELKRASDLSYSDMSVLIAGAAAKSCSNCPCVCKGSGTSADDTTSVSLAKKINP